MRHYINYKNLPVALQHLVDLARGRRGDISIVARESVSVSVGGGIGGERAYVAVTDHALQVCKVARHAFGSFGGPNMFAKSPLETWIAECDGEIAVPEQGAVATGAESCHITIAVRPATLAHLTGGDRAAADVARDAELQGTPDKTLVSIAVPGKPDVSIGDRWVLWVFDHIKSAYRRKYLDEIREKSDGAIGVESHLASLVSRGLLKRAANGATSITTLGRNAHPVECPYRKDDFTTQLATQGAA